MTAEADTRQAQLERPNSLLDIGAGDGCVTAELANLVPAGADAVSVTEASWAMRFRLSRRGYHCLPDDDWENAGPFDLISCLNVLDRCDRPLTLLRQMQRAMTPGRGRLIIAVVLPFRPFVEDGAGRRAPTERISVEGRTIEAQMEHLATRVFEPLGFCVEALSRVPYLCEGDLFAPYYQLDDAIFVLSAGSITKTR